MGEEFVQKKNAFRAFPLALVLLMFSTSAFAQSNSWQPAVGAALLIAVFLIAVAYMVVHMLKLEAFKAILHDEVGQVIMTAAIVGVLVLGAAGFDDMLKDGVFGLSRADEYCTGVPNQMYCDTLGGNTGNPPSVNIRAWALDVNGRNQKFLENRTQKTTEFINIVGEQSSQSGMCNMLGIGFTIAGCSSWGILRTPSGQMLNAAGFATMDLQAERILLMAAQSIALPLLLPLGVLLRSIYFTRQAGSTLIALALSLYFIFPTIILAGQAAADAFISENPKYADKFDPEAGAHACGWFSRNVANLGTEAFECDPFDPDICELKNQMDGIIRGDPSIPGDPSKAEKLIFFVVGRYLLMTALALTATLTATRGIGHLLGTEINVMSIARLS